MRETVITRDMIANPKTKYGRAKASTRHFLTQRVTGAINIAFLVFLLLIVTVHMRNGMRDTLEDYFAGSLYRLLMLLNTLFCILVAVAGVAALLKLVFWG